VAPNGAPPPPRALVSRPRPERHRRIVIPFLNTYPNSSDEPIAIVSAINRLVSTQAVDFGQDVSIVHGILLDRMRKMLGIYQDNMLLDAPQSSPFVTSLPRRRATRSISSRSKRSVARFTTSAADGLQAVRGARCISGYVVHAARPVHHRLHDELTLSY